MSATITCTLCGYHGPKHDVFGQECMRATVERIATLEAQVKRLTEELQRFKDDSGDIIHDLETRIAAKDDALREIAKGSPVYASRGWECQQIARTALGATQE